MRGKGNRKETEESRIQIHSRVTSTETRNLSPTILFMNIMNIPIYRKDIYMLQITDKLMM